LFSSSLPASSLTSSFAKPLFSFFSKQRGPALLTLGLLGANATVKPLLLLQQPNEKKTVRQAKALEAFTTNAIALALSLPVVLLAKSPVSSLLAKATITDEAKEVLSNLLITTGLMVMNLALPLLTHKASTALAQWRTTHLSIHKIGTATNHGDALAKPSELSLPMKETTALSVPATTHLTDNPSFHLAPSYSLATAATPAILSLQQNRTASLSPFSTLPQQAYNRAAQLGVRL
jgi:hypothetical protein